MLFINRHMRGCDGYALSLSHATLPAAKSPCVSIRGCWRTSSRFVCAGILFFLISIPASAEPCRPYDTVVREIQGENLLLEMKWLADNGSMVEIYTSRRGGVTAVATDRNYCATIVSSGALLRRYFPFNGT